MKRFLCMILTVAMLISGIPAVFAENDTNSVGTVTEQEVVSDNQDEITKDNADEISGEGEENSEEQTDLMSGENNISLLADETNEVQYSTDSSTWESATLANAVTAIGTGTGTIKVQNDVTVSAEIKITGNVTLIADGKDVTIKRASTLKGAPVISVASGATLNLGTKTTMENTLTIDGGAVWSGNDGYPNTDAAQSTDKSNNTGVRGNFAIIRTDGTFNMYENVILQNNHNNTSVGNNHSGGGVDIENAGVFNMYGGKIWKCSSASQAEWGGGVTVAGLDYELETPATFNLYGGEICYNSAGIGGGVSVGNPNSSHDHPAIFNMYNGNIHHNKAGSMDAYSGAGVYVADNAVFTMEDGSITENTAEAKNGGALGGGVESVGTFNMSGGTISGNSAKNGGAGIFLMYNNNVDCTANITGGSIINNNGEGIFINDTKVYLNISGNVNISDNTTTGIYIEDGAAPINVENALTVENAIDVNSAITDDGTVIVTFADGLNASDYTNAFKHASKSMIVKENKLVIGVQTYSVTVTDPIYMPSTFPGITPDSKIGTISVTGADDLTAVPEGTDLTLAITVADDINAKNHTFVKWVVKTASDEDVAVTDNKFTMPGEAVTVTAEYVPNIKMVFYAGGTYASTTNECKDYTWNEDGTITYTMPGNKGTLTISTPNGFKLWQYIVDDGTKTPTVTANDVVTVTVNTNEGYMFNGIKSVTDQYEKLTGTFNNSGTYTFSVPVGTYDSYKGAQTAFIILDIAKNQYNITKNFNSNEGSVKVVYSSDTSTEISKAYHGSTIWVGVEPNANYKVKSVKVTDKNNAEVTLDTTYVAEYNTWAFTMPTSDVTVSVEFELDACAITTDIKNGTISGITSTAVIGSDVSFTLAPKDDTYKLNSYKVFKTEDEATTVDVTENNGTYTFKMPDYPVTVSAVFVKKTHDVTITKEGEGTVAISPKTPIEVGQTVNVTATPDEHWELSSLTMNGTDITSAKSFIMPNEAVELKAVFVKKKFSVTTSATTNGKIGLLTSNPLDWGKDFTINVQADSHYEIETVTVDGNAVSVDEYGDYTFEMPTHDVIVSATFKKVKYTITGTGAHATFSIPSIDTYNWGDTVEFTVTPDEWYSIKDVTIAGVEVTNKGNGSYSFEMPTNNVEIKVTAVRPNFNVEFVSNGGSSVNGQVIENGNTVTKPSTPTYVNHGFAGWYTSPTFEAETKYNFSTNVTGNIKLYARWFLWGDVNGDGKVTPFDAVQLDRCYVGSINVESLAVPMAARVTDANKTKPTPFDSVQIKRKYVGSLDRFPVEKTSYEYDLENNKVISE